MPTIQVTDLVFAALAELRINGESHDEYLRKLLGLPAKSALLPAQPRESSPRRASNGTSTRRATLATRRMSSFVSGNQLTVAFADGPKRQWQLSAPSDKAKIRQVRDQAVSFAKENGATIGQRNAVKKALTDAGYHLFK